MTERNCIKRAYLASPKCIEIGYMPMTALCASVSAPNNGIDNAIEEDWGTF